ncbi:unnamed protein product [Lathyrus sativus]|nr:unnamed protein product [Lathyrus sativus]
MENISFIRGFPDQEIMEDPSLCLHQWYLNSIDESNSLPIASAFGDTLQHPSYIYPNFNLRASVETDQRPETQFVSYQNLLSYVDSNHFNQLGLVKPKDEMVCPQNSNTTSDAVSQGIMEAQRISTRNKVSLPQDHIIAERKRREKLSQRFIALSALVPGLQKMDKVTVLGDAIKYLKKLQEKVKALEEERNMKKNVEYVVVVKKSQLTNDVENSSAESGSPFDEELPEIEARFCDRNVLIRIHCEKSKGAAEKSIHEIEKLHLKVINSCVMAFGSCALDITVIAQMDIEFCMTLKDLVTNLRSAFASFI